MEEEMERVGRGRGSGNGEGRKRKWKWVRKGLTMSSNLYPGGNVSSSSPHTGSSSFVTGRWDMRHACVKHSRAHGNVTPTFNIYVSIL